MDEQSKGVSAVIANLMTQVGGKTFGTVVGSLGATFSAKDLTTETLYWAGWETLPEHVLAAHTNLLNQFWGGVLVVGGLYLGHLWNTLLTRWGAAAAVAPGAGTKPTTPQPTE